VLKPCLSVCENYSKQKAKLWSVQAMLERLRKLCKTPIYLWSAQAMLELKRN